MASTSPSRSSRSPRRFGLRGGLAAAVTGLVLVAAPLALAPSAWASPTPTPVESEPPGGAVCLPGGPTTDCAPEADPPGKSGGHASPSPSTTRRASGAKQRSKPPAVDPATPRAQHTPDPADTPTAASGGKGTDTAGKTKSSSGKADHAKATASAQATGRAAVAPQDGPSATSVAYALSDDLTPSGPTTGAPGWVAPVVTMLLVLLAVVLVVGPARRRAGLASHR